MLRDSAAAEPVGRGGLELREKCLPSSSSLPGSTVPSWARHTWPWANWCHWPGWAAGAASSTQRGDTELCSAWGSHSLHSYQEKAKAARMQPQAPSQGCSPIPALWHIPHQSLVGGKGWGHKGSTVNPTCSPKAFPPRAVPCAHEAASTRGFFSLWWCRSCAGATSGTPAAPPDTPRVKTIPAPSPHTPEWLCSPPRCKCR